MKSHDWPLVDWLEGKILLGHATVRITEKHYNPWNRARQVQAEADVQRAWKRDPMVILEQVGNAAATRN